ncbi:CotH kinase family protein [Flavitalea antarctica]
MSTSLRSNPMCLHVGAKTTLFALILLSVSCRKEAYITDQSISPQQEVIHAGDHHELHQFFFSPTHNPSYLTDTIWMQVDGDMITGRTPYGISRKSLIPSFETKAASVVVNGVKQESGNTAHDFTEPVTYRTIGYNGALKDYKVKLINFTGLPVIKITTKNGAVIDSKDIYVDANISIDGAGSYDDFAGEMKIKGRGNYTWTLPKKPYKMKFNNKVSLFGEGEDKEWVLLANQANKNQLNTSAAFLLGDLSRLDWTPDAHFAELFLNDVYQGTYQLCESVKVGENRVNIPKDGFLLEVDQEERMEAGDVFFKTARLLVNIKEPAVVKDDPKYNFVSGFVNAAENALYGPDFKDPVVGYAKYLDVPSLIDWYLINEITKNQDAVFYSSCYMNLTPTGKLKMGPIWDFDFAFGRNSERDLHLPEGFYVRESRWISRLFEDPNFEKQVARRFEHFKANEDVILGFLSESSTKMTFSTIENNKRWQIFTPDVSSTGLVVKLYQDDVQKMKTWFKARMTWLDTAFAAMK